MQFYSVSYGIELRLHFEFMVWQWLDAKGKNKQPYIITLLSREVFAFAGLWSEWIEVEIVFTDPDRIYFDRVNCSDLGNDTIDFFGWDTELNYSFVRSKYLVLERLNPLASNEERLLIQDAISYKKKKKKK